jgi:hypothetical protein
MGLFGKDEPEAATVSGKPFKCQVCGNDRFWQKEAVVHSAAASFMNIEWASPRAELLVCSGCGYVHWFMPDAG